MGTSASFARRIAALVIASLLAFALAPFAYAEGSLAVASEAEGAGVPEGAVSSGEGVASESAGAEEPEGAPGSGSGDAESGSSSDGPALVASALMGQPAAFVNADVALGGEPVVGSFTVEGLTYAVTGEGTVELVSVSDDAAASGSNGLQQALELPPSISYGNTSYALASVAPYAFHLSSVESVTIPATVTDVDGRAFRASSIGSVEVAEGNPEYSSYDGALYGADRTRLLLIPEGKQGSVRVSDRAEAVPSSAFSHCAGVTSVSVDADGAAFSSADDCLYDASGETLLRVPAGATDIAIADGCTAIAAGAMEGCAKLESITAPATVVSISPYAFSQEPETVSLPAASLADGAEEPQGEGSEEGQVDGAEEPEGALGSEVPTSPRPPSGSSMGTAEGVQLSSTVALTASDDSLPEIDPASIEVGLPYDADSTPWGLLGLSTMNVSREVKAQESAAYKATLMISIVAPADFYSNNNETQTSYVQHSHGEPVSITSAAEDYKWTGACVDFKWNAQRRQAGLDTSTSGVTSVYSTLHGYLEKGKVYYRNGKHDTWYFNGSEKPVVTWDPNGGEADPPQTQVTYGGVAESPRPERSGYYCTGWYTKAEGGSLICLAGEKTPAIKLSQTLYAQWAPYILDFDVDSEPGDGDYPGDAKDPMTGDDVSEDGTISIEPPTRPGYIFQGWVPEGEPNDEGLLTEGEDGTWSVDASKIPEYADGNGKVSLTARWTAAISVDAPISATFMYDLSAWDGTESRDAMTIEGSSTVKNRSAVPIRVSGLESSKGSAANVLKKADGTTLADASKGDSAKVLSVFPTTSDATGTEFDAKGGATDDAGDDLAHKVDLALSEVKLEADFDADAWAIEAATVGDNGITVSTGDKKLGYRLNLGSSTGVTLDKDALLAATGDPEAGSSSKAASIADLTYCFAAEGLIPTGSKSDPLWVEVTDPEVGSVGIYGLSDIKRAADDFSSRVDPATDPNDQEAIFAQLAGSPYFGLFRELFEHDVPFHLAVWKTGGPFVYHEAALLGFCQDTRASDGRKAGLTFQTKHVYAVYGNVYEAGDMGSFACYMKSPDSNVDGWQSSYQRTTMLSGTFYNRLPPALRDEQTGIVQVLKYSQYTSGPVDPNVDRIFLPSAFEVFGAAKNGWNTNESASNSFQYQMYAKGGAGASGNPYAAKGLRTGDANTYIWWLRSAITADRVSFCVVDAAGNLEASRSSGNHGILPCFAL